MPIRVERQAEPIPGYRLIERLGGGGFGEVWKAEAPGGLLKAIKFVYGDLQTDGEEGKRAEQELRALSRVKTVRHPFILSLERFDIIEGKLMIVMELADRNLWDRFRECQIQGLPGIPREELTRYLEETAEALDLMNIDYQLQHLDIKPQNLFLVHNHIKVADFGLVKDLQGRTTSVTGGVTPVYAAPETFDGRVSRFCDQYSLAIVYQEMLTGQRPFAASNVHQLILQHVQEKPNLASLMPGDRGPIGRSLAKKADDRYPTCTNLLEALRAAGAAAAASVIETPPPAFSPPGGNHSGKRVFAPSGNDENPSSNAITQASRRPAPKPMETPGTTARVASTPATLFPKRAEISGGGELFPALIVGLGGMGRRVLEKLTAELQGRFGARSALPHVRFLYIDTDPETRQAGGYEGETSKLNASEVLHAKLNRASHFLKPRNRPPIDSWLNNAMLYRITRNQETGGVRALGRLAFFDNYKAIAQRIQGNLEACLDPAMLTDAERNTHLTVRGNRPRVYVICSLGGGTGGGMFIDLAYLTRELLRQQNIPQADIVGLFSLPPATDPARQMALGNCHAALTEVNHFSSPGVSFLARFEEQGDPLQDADSPYSRSFLFPELSGGQEMEETAGLMGEFLCDDLTTALGRLADTERESAQGSGARAKDFHCQALGMFRYSWPRRYVLNQAARRFCQRLVDRWMSKDSKPVRDKVKALVLDQWNAKELGADCLITRLQAACERELKQSPENLLASISDFLKNSDKPNLELKPEIVANAVTQIDDLLGQPHDSTVLQHPGRIEDILSRETETLTQEWQNKVAQFTTLLVEDPEFRLAGSEESVHQAMAQIEQTLKNHEPLFQELTTKVLKGHERLHFLTSSLPDILKNGKKALPFVFELVELVRLYPKWRYQNLILRFLHNIFTSVRGFLSDQIREFSFYRLRLGELLKIFTGPPRFPLAANDKTICHLFPLECQSADELLDTLFPQSGADELLEQDRNIQFLIQENFVGFANLCTSSATYLKDLEAAMVTEMESFIGNRLEEADVMELHADRFTDESQALEEIQRAYDSAAPVIVNDQRPDQNEITVVVVPPGSEGKPLMDKLRRAFPNAKSAVSSNREDIVFYREETEVQLSDLAQVGKEGQNAYRQMAATQQFTPHTRIDIAQWRPLPTGEE